MKHTVTMTASGHGEALAPTLVIERRPPRPTLRERIGPHVLIDVGVHVILTHLPRLPHLFKRRGELASS